MSLDELIYIPAYDEDLGTARARFSRSTLERLGLRVGDPLLIHGVKPRRGIICRAAVSRADHSQSVAVDVSFLAPSASPSASLVVEPIRAIRAESDGRQDGVHATTTTTVEWQGDAEPSGALLEAFLSSCRLSIPAAEPVEWVDALDGTRFGTFTSTPAPRQAPLAADAYVTVDATTAVVERKPVDADGSDDQYKYRYESKQFQYLVGLLRASSRELRSFGAKRPLGVILHGPPGVGKTSCVEAAVAQVGGVLIEVHGYEAVRASSVAGGAEKRLQEAFRKAKDVQQRGGRAVVFIDELEAVCAARSEDGRPQGMAAPREDRTAAQLASLMDHLHEERNVKGEEVMVLAATNYLDRIDLALRRPGRFDYELSFAVPTEDERRELLDALIDDREVAEQVATTTIGFVAADLSALVAQAELERSKRRFPRLQLDHFVQARSIVSASLLRGPFSTDKAHPTFWSEIGGAHDAKLRLVMALEWPIKYKPTWDALGLVRAAATSTESAFFFISGAELYSSYLGEAERILRSVFRDARSAAPSILFLDEIDALAGKRGGANDGNSVQERVLATLLNEMDGISVTVGVLVVAATNRLDCVDEALRRPGRFDDIIQVPLPDYTARQEIFAIHTAKMALGEDVDVQEIARRTEGSSGADIAAICREAAMATCREIPAASHVEMRHFWGAMDGGGGCRSRSLVDT